jgi:hypothetical protein
MYYGRLPPQHRPANPRDRRSPEPYVLGIFAASAIDWDKFLGGSTDAGVAVRYAQHADTWLTILSMWEWEEFLVMFPRAPHFFSPVFMAVVAMLGAAGQREQRRSSGAAGRQANST